MVLARDLGTDVAIQDVLDARKWAEAIFWPVLETMATTPDVRQKGKSLLDSLPAGAVSWALRAGLSTVETAIGITFGLLRYAGDPVTDGLTRGRDYDRIAPVQSFDPNARTPQGYRLRLAQHLIQVSRVRLRLFGQDLLDVDADDAATGSILITDPMTGEVLVRPPTNPSTSGEVGFISPLYFQLRHQIPGVVSVDYTTCPESATGRRGYVPAALADYVWLWAGVRICNQAGTFITRGVTSASIGIDNLSKSVSFQASAMYGVNSSLEAVYKEQMKGIDLAQLRRSLRGISFVPYGR